MTFSPNSKHSAGYFPSFPLHASANLLFPIFFDFPPTCASTLPVAEGLSQRRHYNITSKCLGHELILMPQLLSGPFPVAANMPQRLSKMGRIKGPWTWQPTDCSDSSIAIRKEENKKQEQLVFYFENSKTENERTTHYLILLDGRKKGNE